MHHFFTDTEFINGSEAVITGPDVSHIRNVLRMKPGERILLSDGKGTNLLCVLTEITRERVCARILPETLTDTELPVEVTLFQGLPKGDKFETVVQKCVELGAHDIVPVMTERCVARLEKSKEEARLGRWRSIAENAAAQSKRTIVPRVHGVMTFREALDFAKDYDLALIPYEDAASIAGAGKMALTRTYIGGLRAGQRAAVFIGPEGGFADDEIGLAQEHGVKPVTLGKRILRTETAGLFVLSAIGYALEE